MLLIQGHLSIHLYAIYEFFSAIIIMDTLTRPRTIIVLVPYIVVILKYHFTLKIN